METKFVKAYCDKAKQYFALEVKKFGLTWKVTNFTYLSADEAKLTATEVDQRTFETNSNLIPCAGCKSRKVGGCSCAKKKNQCTPGMKYHFNCIYCDQLKIDYSLPTMDGIQGARAGEKVTLSQGQEVVIRFADNRPLTNILVGVGWDPVSQGDNMDVDSSVVVMSSNGAQYDLVYYGAKRHSSGCAELLEDNLTGEYTGHVDSNDDENILVDLTKVPRGRDKLVFLINIYECDDRHQTLKDVKNFYIRLCDQVSKKTLIEYKVEDNQVHPKDTAIVIGVATRKNGGWTFKAIGRSLRISTVQDLARECSAYI